MQLLDTKTQSLTTSSLVCLGFFDGVHLGHLALLNCAKNIAQKEGGLVCVHTFDVSPTQQIRKDGRWFELTPLSKKIELLEQHGCQVVAISSFDQAMRQMKGRDFFEKILIKCLKAKVLVTGWDHRLGFQGDTDVVKLQSLCDEYHIRLEVISKVSLPTGERVSSTAIREALLCGNKELAEAMLGRNVDEDTGLLKKLRV